LSPGRVGRLSDPTECRPGGTQKIAHSVILSRTNKSENNSRCYQEKSTFDRGPTLKARLERQWSMPELGECEGNVSYIIKIGNVEWDR
jgi:hypothetical protein